MTQVTLESIKTIMIEPATGKQGVDRASHSIRTNLTSEGVRLLEIDAVSAVPEPST